MGRRKFITLLGGALSVFLCVSAAAQEGYYGEGHDKWHQGFYSKLKRNDGQGSCCNLMDCRPGPKSHGWRPLRSQSGWRMDAGSQ